MIIERKQRKKRSKIWTIPTDQLSQLVRDSQNIAQVLKYFGYGPTGGTHAVLKRRLVQDKIDFTHMKMGIGTNQGRHFNFKMTKEEALSTLFTEKSNRSPKVIRSYVKHYSLIEYKCELCSNNGKWREIPLSLQLDHKNGINNDHRLSNLRWLCPNCHTQTETFGSRNKVGCMTNPAIATQTSQV